MYESFLKKVAQIIGEQLGWSLSFGFIFSSCEIAITLKQHSLKDLRMAASGHALDR